MFTTDDGRRRRGSVTSQAGDYNSDNDLEEALMLGVQHGQSARRTRARLVRSHSITNTTTSQQDPDLADTERGCMDADQGRGQDGGAGQKRVRRPMSARRFRLTSSFDDGCSDRERISSTTISTVPTSSISSDNINFMHLSEKQLDTSSSRHQSQKPCLRPSSAAGIGVNRSTSHSSSLRDQPRSNTLQAGMKGQRETRRNTAKPTAKCYMPTNSAKNVPDINNHKDTTSSKRPPPRAPLPVRRTSLDMKTHDSVQLTNGRQSTTAHRPRNRDQSNSQAGSGIHLSGTMSANSSPSLTRRSQLHLSRLSTSHTARYQCFSLFLTTYTQDRRGSTQIATLCDYTLVLIY